MPSLPGYIQAQGLPGAESKLEFAWSSLSGGRDPVTLLTKPDYVWSPWTHIYLQSESFQSLWIKCALTTKSLYTLAQINTGIGHLGDRVTEFLREAPTKVEGQSTISV